MKIVHRLIFLMSVAGIGSTIQAQGATCIGCGVRPVPQTYQRKAICYDEDMTGSMEIGTNARLSNEDSTMDNKYCES